VITILNGRHLALLLRHLREGRHLSRRELARRLFVAPKTVANREHAQRILNTDDLIDTAYVLGFDVALMPRRHPGARPTGTGWPT
jgi:transcriptional regulator with XRE-family HTH domain